VNYLKSRQLPDITLANAKSLDLLSQEFGVFELSSRCGQLVSDLQAVDSPIMSVGAGLNTHCLNQAAEFESFRRSFPFCMSDFLASRLEQIEGEIARFCSDVETRLILCSSNCEELRCTIPLEVSKLESRLEPDLSDLKATCRQFQSEIRELTIIPRSFPLDTEAPLSGIICELTRQHGKVHDKGIVLVRSKSEEEGDVKNRIDLGSDLGFRSKDEPDQWVCWEFRDGLVRPTHYTIRSSKDNYLKSWSVEGSMDSDFVQHWKQNKGIDEVKRFFTESMVMTFVFR
jgi:hypothetical protein